MSYRVCIPCAGTGSRLAEKTKYLNKCLVNIGIHATISLIINKYSSDTEFVVALGYKGELVREFLKLAHPDRIFHYVDVFPYEGEQAGLGRSLQMCKQYLQQPFVFNSCDTIVGDSIPAPDTNWMGYCSVSDVKEYRSLVLDSGKVKDIIEKSDNIKGTRFPYIGLAGVHDIDEFWRGMDVEQPGSIVEGEACGMRHLLRRGVQAYEFDWNDTGNKEALARCIDKFQQVGDPRILEKERETIWFVGNTVVKFSVDKGFILNRVKRAMMLQPYVPVVKGHTEHMYSYEKADGVVFSSIATVGLLKRLLNVGKDFWLAKTMTAVDYIEFKKKCLEFYHDKTHERVSLFHAKCGRDTVLRFVNNEPVRCVSELLDSIDWDWLSEGLPGQYHGDFHFENVLWQQSQEKFVFVDWRQDFGGTLAVGDIYYDLAKLLHGMIINHDIISKGLFRVSWDRDLASYDFHRTYNLIRCEDYFKEWIIAHGYDLKKVYLITSLIYLNIAPLHKEPYSLLLYALGISMLSKELLK